MYFFVVWFIEKKRLALFTAWTIVRDPHHRESPTRREHDLNLPGTRVQTSLNEVVCAVVIHLGATYLAFI